METFEDWLRTNKDVTTEETERICNLLSLFNAGREHQQIELPFSQSDLEDLMNGDEHNWAFPTDRGETIDIRLYNEDYEQNDEDTD